MHGQDIKALPTFHLNSKDKSTKGREYITDSSPLILFVLLQQRLQLLYLQICVIGL